MSEHIEERVAARDEIAPEEVELPPDGSIIRVSEWRRQILWIPVPVYAALTLYGLGLAAQKGSVAAGLLSVLGGGLATYLSARGAVGGLILERQGVKARGTWRTYHWKWEKIDRFELRKRGEGLRLRVHSIDGSDHGFMGFFARSPQQEARAQALFRALEERLAREKLDRN